MLFRWCELSESSAVGHEDPRRRQDRPPKADKRGQSSLQNSIFRFFLFFNFFSLGRFWSNLGFYLLMVSRMLSLFTSRFA